MRSALARFIVFVMTLGTRMIAVAAPALGHSDDCGHEDSVEPEEPTEPETPSWSFAGIFDKIFGWWK